MFGRVKPLDAILATAEKKSLHRSLGAFQLTMLGIGGIIGTGIFVLTAAAAQKAGPGMILSFVVVIEPNVVGSMASAPIGRADLARSEATGAPRDIAYQQVMEHGIRHLAWLVADDPVVAGELSGEWRRVLAEYVPEPFRALG